MSRATLVALVIGLAGAGALFAGGDTTVILVRHAEKELSGGDVPLAEPLGTQRADDLVAAVASAGVDVAISSRFRRTKMTLEPTVASLELPAERVLEITEPADVAREILDRQRGRTILVAGHSNSVPQIIEALGAPSLCPPFEIDPTHGCMIPDPEYDHLFVVTVPAEGPPTVVRARYGEASRGLAGAAVPVPESSVSRSEELAARLDGFRSFLVDYRRENLIQSFSVAVVRQGEIVFAEGFGWQDHDAEEPTTAETTYLAASITKTFTAATLLAMDAAGEIDLDEDFTTLSDWDDRCSWLSRSGIIFGGGTTEDGMVIPPVRCAGPLPLREVLRHRVNGESGTDFVYNPVVFGRLSNFVEERTGRAWREWMHEHVLVPAELTGVAAGWRDPGRGDVLTRLAPPFRHAPDDRDGIEPSVLPNPELNASSGIISGVLGLARYAIALNENRILPEKLKEEMWTPASKASGEPEPYAYGWYVQEWRGQRLVWHGGWWPDAYAGLLLIAPEAGWTLVALGNTDGIHWGNPLDRAEVERSALAAEFLERFVASGN